MHSTAAADRAHRVTYCRAVRVRTRIDQRHHALSAAGRMSRMTIRNLEHLLSFAHAPALPGKLAFVSRCYISEDTSAPSR
jgi:hypothetical protein